MYTEYILLSLFLLNDLGIYYIIRKYIKYVYLLFVLFTFYNKIYSIGTIE